MTQHKLNHAQNDPAEAIMNLIASNIEDIAPLSALSARNSITMKMPATSGKKLPSSRQPRDNSSQRDTYTQLEWKADIINVENQIQGLAVAIEKALGARETDRPYRHSRDMSRSPTETARDNKGQTTDSSAKTATVTKSPGTAVSLREGPLDFWSL